MIRCAIIGLGRWGKSLVDSVKGDDAAIRFVAGMAPRRAATEAFCAEHGLRFVDKYDDILADPDVDAVVIASPNTEHVEQACRAAAAGKHVFVEKPLAFLRRDAERALEAADRARVTLAVGYVRRFHPSVDHVRQMFKTGRMGALCGIVAQQTSATAPYLPAGNWRISKENSSGLVLADISVHLIDHAIEFGGRIDAVQCNLACRGAVDAADTASILLWFASGATGALFCSVTTGPNYRLSVYGSKGLAEVSESTLRTFRFVPIPDAAPRGPVVAPAPEIIETEGFDMIRAELLAFAHSVESGEPFPVPLADVLHGTSVLEGIVESARSGARVAIR